MTPEDRAKLINEYINEHVRPNTHDAALIVQAAYDFGRGLDTAVSILETESVLRSQLAALREELKQAEERGALSLQECYRSITHNDLDLARDQAIQLWRERREGK